MTLVMPDGVVGLGDLAGMMLSIALIFVIPGAAWHLVFWPARSGIGRLERLALVMTTSYLLCGVTVLVLARAGALQGGAIQLGIVAVSLAGIGTTIWRARGIDHPLGAMFRVPTAADLVYAVAITAIPLGVLVIPQVLLLFPTGTPVGTITWYYWGLAQQIADAGTVPMVSGEWGGSYRIPGRLRHLQRGLGSACRSWRASPRTSCRWRPCGSPAWSGASSRARRATPVLSRVSARSSRRC